MGFALILKHLHERGEPEFRLTDDEAFKLSSAFFNVMKYFVKVKLAVSPKWTALGGLGMAIYAVYLPKLTAYKARVAAEAKLRQPGPTGSQETDPSQMVVN